ncbi:carboxymuconolactone decarboxylase family protein [Candidimonas humi]|jgi:AhpD family alkylhydroperoxidase|uniref:Carboxymuconolactone decarboxylase family protein n=1 Tax=Candidimonas humi TaxID=683355 RepID=A0ABV8P3X8_9BURK|nr:carboxymuconolactone decarboxylase family protein [Candidimonas humi]MBV6306882.1 carboxymuconolactone decarboxylase family protein [Candidimonas humi]
MLNNWVAQMENTRAAAAPLAKNNPKLLAAFQGLNAAQTENGALDAKTRELIALAVAVTTRCDSCIAAHANAARKAGVTEAELGDALSTAIALNAGAAYVYSLRAMEAHGQFSQA